MLPRLLLAGLIACQACPASARTILITNDDGLTSNVRALHDALKAAGHDVVVVVPCTNQSGMSAAIRIAAPIGPLAADCRSEAAKAGAPGTGPMTRPGLGRDYHYANGTPVMALLYGLDVVARKRWGRAPDLVLSGPNEGQNVGPLVIASGTVGAAQYAAIRSIPSIALSAGVDTADDAGLANPKSAFVARKTAELVAYLDRQSRGKRMLPADVALNVNFPDDPGRSGWKLARIGSYSLYRFAFDGDAGQLVLEQNRAEPGAGQREDEAVVFRTGIAISVMQVAYDQAPARRAEVARMFRGLTGRQ